MQDSSLLERVLAHTSLYFEEHNHHANTIILDSEDYHDAIACNLIECPATGEEADTVMLGLRVDKGEKTLACHRHPEVVFPEPKSVIQSAERGNPGSTDLSSIGFAIGLSVGLSEVD